MLSPFVVGFPWKFVIVLLKLSRIVYLRLNYTYCWGDEKQYYTILILERHFRAKNYSLHEHYLKSRLGLYFRKYLDKTDYQYSVLHKTLLQPQQTLNLTIPQIHISCKFLAFIHLWQGKRGQLYILIVWEDTWIYFCKSKLWILIQRNCVSGSSFMIF